ncbi:general secretion pathway protein GspB [Vibrio sp.]|nr:general secretion pathway protein GspB [Vibrio sp.]
MSNLLKSLEASNDGYQRNQTASTLSMPPLFDVPLRRNTGATIIKTLVLSSMIAGGIAWGVVNSTRVSEFWDDLQQGQALDAPENVPLQGLDYYELDYPRFSSLLVINNPTTGRPTVDQRQTTIATVIEPVSGQNNPIENNSVQSSSIQNNAIESPVIPSEGELVSTRTVVDGELLTLEDLDLSGLSPELAGKINDAMSQSNHQSVPKGTYEDVIALESSGQRFDGVLPAMDFQIHIYSDEESKRWVKVNDHEYVEGDIISDQVTLLRIEPQACVLDVSGVLVRIPALYTWFG